LGTPVKERVAGADLFGALAERAAEAGYRLFYLGAAPGVAEKAAAVLAERYPGLNVVGTFSPPVMPWEELARDEETLRRIREAKPDVLFVAFGAPKQEMWLDAVRDRLGVPVGIGVGAAFDFAAGTVKRAPRWMQRVGLEWLFRLTQEPRRLWRRYLFVDSRFACYVLKEKFRGRKAAAQREPE
jgi:N-acetylglucosaminyldiphosphoundecaprenol N-acetyl-beta-D-mannosaminyltransferase